MNITAQDSRGLGDPVEAPGVVGAEEAACAAGCYTSCASDVRPRPVRGRAAEAEDLRQTLCCLRKCLFLHADSGAPICRVLPKGGPLPLRHWLNGYLVIQGNIPFGTAPFKQFLELLARKRLGTRWAKYPFSRCRTTSAGGGRGAPSSSTRPSERGAILCGHASWRNTYIQVNISIWYYTI